LVLLETLPPVKKLGRAFAVVLAVAALGEKLLLITLLAGAVVTAPGLVNTAAPELPKLAVALPVPAITANGSRAEVPVAELAPVATPEPSPPARPNGLAATASPLPKIVPLFALLTDAGPLPVPPLVTVNVPLPPPRPPVMAAPRTPAKLPAVSITVLPVTVDDPGMTPVVPKILLRLVPVPPALVLPEALPSGPVIVAEPILLPTRLPSIEVVLPAPVEGPDDPLLLLLTMNELLPPIVPVTWRRREAPLRDAARFAIVF
jgi:hypothetical protein